MIVRRPEMRLKLASILGEADESSGAQPDVSHEGEVVPPAPDQEPEA